MERFRHTWLALMGGILLLTFSVSAALGARPSGSEDGTRGQSIATFVHGVVFGTDEETAEEAEDGTDGDADEDANEDEDESADEDSEQESTEETVDPEDSASGSEHGACVAAVAQDHEAVGGPNENHGGAVSEAARDTCWQAADDEEAADEDADVSDVEETSDDADALTAKEQRKADREAARAERRELRGANGHGGGRGHGRP